YVAPAEENGVNFPLVFDIPQGPLTLSNGTITDVDGNDAINYLDPASGAAAQTAGGTIEDNLVSISVLDMDGRDLYSGDEVTVIVNYDEAVFVDGTPEVQFTLDNKDSISSAAPLNYAEYVSGSGTSTLTFTHHVMTDDSIAKLVTDASAGAGGATQFPTIALGAGSIKSVTEFITELSASGTSSGDTYHLENNLDTDLQFPDSGFTIAVGDPSDSNIDSRNIVLQKFTGMEPGAITFESKGSGVVHILENDMLKFVATLNSDGTVLIDGTVMPDGSEGSGGKMLLKDVPFMTDLYDNTYYNTLEDSLDSEADTSHEVNGSFFGGDTLVVGELIDVNLNPEWVTTIDVNGTIHTLSDADGVKRAELVEEQDTSYELTTYADDAITVLETYAISGTETLSITGSNGNVTKDLESNDTLITQVSHIALTSGMSSNDVLVEGNVITVTVDFSEAVSVTGSPTIGLMVGTESVEATYRGHTNHTFTQDGSGNITEESPFAADAIASTAHVFEYIISNNDVGTSVYVDSSSLLQNTAAVLDEFGTITTPASTILTAAGNAPELDITTVTSDDLMNAVDAVKPTVTSIEIQPNDGDGTDSDTLVEDQSIDVFVTFSEAITVTETPTIGLQIGDDTVLATYSGPASADTLSTTKTFTYIIQDGLMSNVPITIVANSLLNSSGTMLDAAGNSAVLDFVVDNVYTPFEPPISVDSADPVVIGVNITSDADGADTLVEGDVIKVQVDFNEDITVTGTPTIELEIGDKFVDAEYSIADSTGSPNAMTFIYTIEDGQVDIDGISVVTNTLTNSPAVVVEDTTTIPLGTIEDTAGNTAKLDHLGELNSSMHVDAIKPEVDTMVMTSTSFDGSQAGSILVEGDDITVTVTFTEDVRVTGLPTIDLQIGNDIVLATYSGLASADTLSTTKTFTYTIEDGKEADNGTIEIINDSLAHSAESTILDAAGNAAVMLNDAQFGLSSSAVDSIDPKVTEITDLTIVKNNNEADELSVTVTFSEDVLLATAASATLTLLVDNDNGGSEEVIVSAIGVGGSFKDYTFKVNLGDLPVGLFDTDSVQVNANSLDYVDGDFTDAAGNSVSKTFVETSLTLEDTSLYQSIDTRANKESKQTEGYGTFSKLVDAAEDNVTDGSPQNILFDATNPSANDFTPEIPGTITGGDGLDQIFGGDDAESLFGGKGSDFLKGGGGNDILDGGEGNDFVFADAGNDTVKGGEGNDTIMFDELTSVGNQLVIDLFKDVSAQATNVDLGTNTISSIENVIGTSSGDLIDGNGYDNIIDGAGGGDVIKGGRGNDELYGGAGEDMLYGGRGNDTLEGGQGHDTLSGGAGQDKFVFTLTDDDGFSLTSADSDTVINFNHYADKVEVDGLAATQAVHLLAGKLFIRDNSADQGAAFDGANDLLLAEGFNTFLTDTHLEIFLTETYLDMV
ncbi:MAG: hypothetical protein ACI9S7_000552, partial [Candidatus Paceibacteria bacterium]